MGPVLTDIAGATQAHRTNPLRDSAFHAGSAGIECFKLLRLRPLPGLLERMIVQLLTHRDGATRVARRVRTQRAAGTGLAISHREFDLDDRVLAVIQRRGPADTGFALGAGGLLSGPVDLKLARGEARLLLRLPVVIRPRGSYQINFIV